MSILALDFINLVVNCRGYSRKSLRCVKDITQVRWTGEDQLAWTHFLVLHARFLAYVCHSKLQATWSRHKATVSRRVNQIWLHVILQSTDTALKLGRLALPSGKQGIVTIYIFLLCQPLHTIFCSYVTPTLLRELFDNGSQRMAGSSSRNVQE
jgi:hypothetical protein